MFWDEASEDVCMCFIGWVFTGSFFILRIINTCACHPLEQFKVTGYILLKMKPKAQPNPGVVFYFLLSSGRLLLLIVSIRRSSFLIIFHCFWSDFFFSFFFHTHFWWETAILSLFFYFIFLALYFYLCFFLKYSRDLSIFIWKN